MGEPALLVDDLRVVLGIAPPPCDDSPKGPYPHQHTTYNIQPKHNNRTSTKRKRVRRALDTFDEESLASFYTVTHFIFLLTNILGCVR